jgi:protein-tyrosine kinase
LSHLLYGSSSLLPPSRAEMRAGRRFILVIDEAQNLDERVLESVRLLSNFETPWMKLMQIVIAGQPQLAELLTRPSMAQLQQRIPSVIRIEPFTAEETGEYIDHPLWVAGYTGEPLFTVGARLLIANQSGGTPRNINRLCFNAMSVAYGIGARQVDVKMVREAINDVEMESRVPRAERTPPRMATPGRTVLPFRTMHPKRKERRVNRLIPAFAVVCALLLFAVSARVGWNVGKRTPPFDVLFTEETEAPTQVASPLPAAAAEDSVETVTRVAAAVVTDPEILASPREDARGSDAAAVPTPTVAARHRKIDDVIDDEVMKLVQRVFILPGAAQAPGAVAFAGVDRAAGCSWVCAHTSEVLADQVTGSVCIADANLRAPSLHEHFRFSNGAGFTEAMNGTKPMHEYARRASGSQLWLITAGATGKEPTGAPNPARLRARIGELRDEFDYVLLDTPPIHTYGDVALLAQLTDGTILVVGSNTTRREPAGIPKESLEAARVPILGAVLNKRTFPMPEVIYRNL